MKVYNIVTVGTRKHVVCTVTSRSGGVDNPNYMGTGMALCGVMKKGETLEQWKKRVGK